MNSSSIKSPALPLYLCSDVGTLFFFSRILVWQASTVLRAILQVSFMQHEQPQTLALPLAINREINTHVWLSIVPVPSANLTRSVCLSLGVISRAPHYGNAKNCPWQEPNPHMLRFWRSSVISGTRMSLLILEEWILLDKIIDQHGSPTLEVGLSQNSVAVFKFWWLIRIFNFSSHPHNSLFHFRIREGT